MISLSDANIRLAEIPSFEIYAQNILREFSTKSWPIQPIIRLSPDWGSNDHRHRENIRSSLFHSLINLGIKADQESICNLSQIPIARGASISISHCPQLGGYVLAQDYPEIGLDIERLDRVSHEALARVAGNASVGQSEPAIIWAAQEAAFKSLSSHVGLGIRLQSQVTVSNLDTLRENVWKYTASLKDRIETSRGIVFIIGDFVIAFAAIST